MCCIVVAADAVAAHAGPVHKDFERRLTHTHTRFVVWQRNDNNRQALNQQMMLYDGARQSMQTTFPTHRSEKCFDLL